MGKSGEIMKRKIIRDVMLLSQKSTPATLADLQTVVDLEDTLRANYDICVGMAANMIGIRKCIIVISILETIVPMLNPEIIKCSQPYTAEESCLSLDGVRSVKRYKNITVKYQDRSFKTCISDFSGFTAQIIQHEIDHCNGVVV